jgi:hypothetical protein
MHRLLPICLLAGLSWAGQAQSVILTVVSDGLYLRERPSSSSPALAVLPFGARVGANRDSIDDSLQHTFVPEHAEDLYLASRQEIRPGLTPKGGAILRDTGWLQGLWWPVEYGELRGYMFSAFLYEGELDPGGPDSIELLSELGDTRLFWRRDWHWYGLYDRKGAAELRPIRPYWTVEWDENDGGRPRLVTGQRQRALFVIASKEPLPLEEYRGSWPNDDGSFEPVIDLRATNPRPNANLLDAAQLEVEWAPAEPAGGLDAITKVWAKNPQGERQQILPPADVENWAAENLYVGWYGDLDGDERYDYILGQPIFEEHYTRFWLFLSSRAEKRTLVKLVSQAGLFDGFD